MKYRIHPKTGDRISELGFGSAYISEVDEKTGISALEEAISGGINYFDMATADIRCFPYYAKALGSIRKDIFYQVHFGANYDKGTYGWSMDLESVKRNIDRMLTLLKTDFIDYGFIHCIDEVSDWNTYRKNGTFDYLMKMKEQGVVKHMGLSSHTPEAIRTILDEAPVETLMFSVNPAYDYQKGAYANGSVDERAAIYRRCETEGIGIVVMKPFSGGQLFDRRTSPFGQAMTPYQVMQYDLDRPGVLTLVPGMSRPEEVRQLLGFFDAPDKEKDYSVMGTFSPAEAIGKCVYCNHCKPCPQGIDIGLVNKYYDLAVNGDTMAADHYQKLSVRADSCISCGHCNKRCPFSVDQVKRMKEIDSYFSKIKS